MNESLSTPGMTLALVLAETTVGGAAVLWAAPLWGAVRIGFYKLAGAVLAVAGVLAWLAARGPLGGTSASGGRGVALWLLAATAGVAVVWQVLLWGKAHAASRIAGLAVVPVGVAALVALALLPGARHGAALGIFQLLAGAVFAGAVTDGLLLGHWHLVDRRLSHGPIRRINQILLGGSAVAAVAAITAAGGGGTATTSFSPLLGAGALAAFLAVGLIGLCAFMGFFIRALIKEGSIQAATGFFYLAVIMGLSAEFAAKVRFF